MYAKRPTDLARGKPHGSVDLGLSCISAKRRRCRIDIDAEVFIFHIKVVAVPILLMFVEIFPILVFKIWSYSHIKVLPTDSRGSWRGYLRFLSNILSVSFYLINLLLHIKIIFRYQVLTKNC